MTTTPQNLSQGQAWHIDTGRQHLSRIITGIIADQVTYRVSTTGRTATITAQSFREWIGRNAASLAAGEQA